MCEAKLPLCSVAISVLSCRGIVGTHGAAAEALGVRSEVAQFSLMSTLPCSPLAPSPQGRADWSKRGCTVWVFTEGEGGLTAAKDLVCP